MKANVLAVVGFIAFGLFFQPASAQVRRLLPDNNLAYPVLVRVGTSSGSGFFVRADRNVFLVTAGHVLFDVAAKKLFDNEAILEALSQDPSEVEKNTFRLNLRMLQESRQLRFDTDRDVAVVRIATVTTSTPMHLIETSGVATVTNTKGGIVSAPVALVAPFRDAFVSNQIYVFGYPGSIGIRDFPQIDFSRPLLRAGVVAGLNARLKTIIIDAPVNHGNSGGPVLQISPNGELRIIGVVTQFVPVLEDTIPKGTQKVLSNSGYAVVASMDAVIAMLSEF
jgi:S1-C subfamily serine protease